ncbi:MAG: class I SAM-dependent methyltransferase [Lachnospiraceae bacterium]|nr:class I SAM-dependent methyltransferase [Lachnospiraceae bacterium]
MAADEKWQHALDTIKDGRNISLGELYSYDVDHDIKHLGFTLSRYKFVSKLLQGNATGSVLELGSSYGLGAPYVVQTADNVRYVGIDFDTRAVNFAKETYGSERVTFIEGDFLLKDLKQLSAGGNGFDSIFSLDVIEHIRTELEDDFVRTITTNLNDTGFAVIGTPNINMDPYASETSKAGHINLYDQKRLFELCARHFNTVFMFGMNDEVVHTGFAPMSCYLFAVCSYKKR